MEYLEVDMIMSKLLILILAMYIIMLVGKYWVVTG